MPQLRRTAQLAAADGRGEFAPDARQTAAYTYDMLISLKKLATVQGQDRLVAFLEIAAAEAQTLIAESPGP